MELDEFKQRYKEKEPDATRVHSANELERYTHKRTSSIINNIKRSIVFELIACGIFIAAAIWAWFSYPFIYVKSFCVLAVVLCVFLLMYLRSLYKTISHFEKDSPAVKDSLQQVIIILQRFTRVYFQFTMITLPVAFVFGLLTGFVSVYDTAPANGFNWQKGVLFYSAWFIFWSALMYFFSKWYIKKLYGNYLEQLKEQLKDIENG